METPKRGRLLAKEEEDWDERVTDAGEWKKVEMIRGTKTIVALPSGKFLRVTLEIALGSFRMVWKVTR